MNWLASQWSPVIFLWICAGYFLARMPRLEK